MKAAISIKFAPGDKVWFMYKDAVQQGQVRDVITRSTQEPDQTKEGKPPHLVTYTEYVVDAPVVGGAKLHESQLFESKPELLDHL